MDALESACKSYLGDVLVREDEHFLGFAELVVVCVTCRCQTKLLHQQRVQASGGVGDRGGQLIRGETLIYVALYEGVECKLYPLGLRVSKDVMRDGRWGDKRIKDAFNRQLQGFHFLCAQGGMVPEDILHDVVLWQLDYSIPERLYEKDVREINLDYMYLWDLCSMLQSDIHHLGDEEE